MALSRLSSILWQISVNQLKALRAKTEGSWGRWNSTSPLELKSCLSFHPANLPCGFRPKNLISTLTWNSNLPAYPSDFVLARSHNCMSPFLKISLFIYILLALFLGRILTYVTTTKFKRCKTTSLFFHSDHCGLSKNAVSMFLSYFSGRLGGQSI